MAHVFRGRLVVRLQCDHHVGIGRSCDATVVVAQVNSGSGQANVIDDPLEFLGWDILFDHGFDLIDELGRFFDPRSSHGADVQLKRSRIHRRKEILAKKRHQDP